MENRADIQQRDVFISWTGSDVELKKKIADYLKTQGLNPLLSDEECQGDFEEWSRSASTSAHIFMPIITKNSLKSEGMRWELEEIDKKLCSPEKGFWKNAIVPVCESLEVYSEYKSMLSQEAQKEIRLISTALLGDTQNPLSEKVLQTIVELIKNRIAYHFFGLYRAKAKPNFIKLIPLNTKLQTSSDRAFKIEDLYLSRKLIEQTENQERIVHETPEKLVLSGNVSFICGPAGSGKTQYVNQIFNYAKEKLVIQLSCPKVSASDETLFSIMFNKFYRACGERKYYTVEHFKRLLETRDLVLVIDGLDEIATKEATRKLVEKVEEYFKVYKNSTALIFTGRNLKDGDLLVFGEQKAGKFLLEKLSEKQIELFGNNLFLLFGNSEKSSSFYVSVKDLNEEIRSNPLLLSQLAIVYNDSGKIPESIVGILEAVAEITFKTDSEMHSDISAIPSRFEDMISYDISDILKDFSRELYIKDPEKDGFEDNANGLSFKKIMQHVLGVRYKERGNALDLRTEFLLEYLQNRAIFCDGEFYHKMFLEYFTALSFWEECFDDYDGEIVDNRPIATLFANYSSEYWREVIKLFLIKADSVLGEKQTRNFYGIIFNQSKILDYTLLLETSKDLIVNKQSAHKAIITDVLTKSISGEYSAYGPLFWYIPEYNLYSELLLLANEFLGNAKALALIRDVCFICGNIYNASEFLLETDCEILYNSISESVHGVRKGLLELFFTGETSFIGGADVYPRCFNVNEARAFMHMGHGLFARMNTPFEDELELFSHTQVNELNGEYIGFISMSYNKEEIERKLNEKSCLKVRTVAFAQTESKVFEYLSFTRSSVKTLYVPENIITFNAGCYNFFKLYLVVNHIDNFLCYIPADAKKLYVSDKVKIFDSSEREERDRFTKKRVANPFTPVYAIRLETKEMAKGLLISELEEIYLPATPIEIGDYAFCHQANLKKVSTHGKITRIGKRAFMGCDKLQFFEIPNGSLTEIGDYAFANCKGLEYFYIPSGVTKIGSNAFLQCINLKQITLCEGITQIGDFTFKDCWSLQEIALPLSLQEIGAGCFKGCDKLQEIVIPNGVSVISKWAFENCKKLNKVKMPKTITNIESGAFINCCALEEFEFPPYLQEIGDSAFASSGIKELNLPKELKKIGKYAFWGCMSLSCVDLPDSVTEIGENAFESCLYIRKIKLSSSLTEIPNCAFKHCYTLNEIEIGDGIKKIGDFAFDCCHFLNEIKLPSSLESIGEYAFFNCWKLKEVDLPIGLISLGSYVFQSCENLRELTIPKTIQNLSSTFNRGSSIEKLYIPKKLCYLLSQIKEESMNKIEVYCTETGLPFENTAENSDENIIKKGTTVILKQAFKESKLENIVIPEGVVKIEEYAFVESNLKQVTLPNTLTEIENGAFLLCINLKAISLPDNVKEISNSTFLSCATLEEVKLPANLKVIRANAFKDCLKLFNVELPPYLERIEEGAFSNTAIADIAFNDNLQEIGAGAFKYNHYLEEVVLPRSLQKLGGSAFESCTWLQKVEFNSNIFALPKSVFAKCVNLKEVKLPLCLEIANEAFKNCEAIESIAIPPSVALIGVEAFNGCSSLKEINLSEVSRIMINAFKDCYSLEKVVLSERLDEIENGAFLNCIALKEVNLPKNLKKIGWASFAGCKSLQKIELGSSITEISKSAFSMCETLEEVIIPISVRHIGIGAFAKCTGLKRVVISANFKDSIKDVFGDIDEKIITFI